MGDDFEKTESAERLRREMVEGLLYAHSILNDTTKKMLDTASKIARRRLLFQG